MSAPHVLVPAGGDPWWDERPPDLEGRTRLEACAETAAGIWRAQRERQEADGAYRPLDYAVDDAIALLVREDPDDVVRGQDYLSAVERVKEAVRARGWEGQ